MANYIKYFLSVFLLSSSVINANPNKSTTVSTPDTTNRKLLLNNGTSNSFKGSKILNPSDKLKSNIPFDIKHKIYDKYTIPYEHFVNNNFSNVNKPVIGAGILPIAKNPKTGKLMLLFGKETYYNKDLNCNKKAWIDMGGFLEQTATQTALAKLFDETAGAFYPTNNFFALMSNKKEFESSQSSKLMPIDLARDVYASFLLPVNFVHQSVLKQRMEINRSFLNRNKNQSAFKIEDFIWIPVEEVLKELKTGKHILRDGIPTAYRFIGGLQNFKNNKHKNRIVSMLEDLVSHQNK